MPVRTQMCLLLGLKLVFGALQRTATASAYLLITCPLLDDYGPPGVVGVGGGDGLSPLHKRAWERVLQSVQVLLETTPSLRCAQGLGRTGLGWGVDLSLFPLDSTCFQRKARHGAQRSTGSSLGRRGLEWAWAADPPPCGRRPAAGSSR